ncbi:unnamed protein product [Didymodactylos carnosus]|uniref:EF-hand domain-containing protein n=1 Tax=Didymodactylos carnosus TaxID=1234261 RepID=A0A815KD33_9BILA|nr:unnamed protein product [Didymodactylos carnosus]CAF1394084.1 unnamed protein product [Didymodactylos carnosus]CAF4171233.1 unnamed protein product [Didymodactylos carnosus]CAF4288347.1 unnamed protein product [Didymodactylos carnosus]
MGNTINRTKLKSFELPERLTDDQILKIQSLTGCSKRKIEHYFKLYKLNHPSGIITKKQFIQAFNQLCPCICEDPRNSRDAFKRIDFKHNGKIDFEEYIIGMESKSKTLRSMTVIDCGEDDNFNEIKNEHKNE